MISKDCPVNEDLDLEFFLTFQIKFSSHDIQGNNGIGVAHEKKKKKKNRHPFVKVSFQLCCSVFGKHNELHIPPSLLISLYMLKT